MESQTVYRMWAQRSQDWTSRYTPLFPRESCALVASGADFLRPKKLLDGFGGLGGGIPRALWKISSGSADSSFGGGDAG